ncbi:hypothetical protein EON82_22720, partial [bacterium]
MAKSPDADSDAPSNSPQNDRIDPLSVAAEGLETPVTDDPKRGLLRRTKKAAERNFSPASDTPATVDPLSVLRSALGGEDETTASTEQPAVPMRPAAPRRQAPRKTAPTAASTSASATGD